VKAETQTTSRTQLINLRFNVVLRNAAEPAAKNAKNSQNFSAKSHQKKVTIEKANALRAIYILYAATRGSLFQNST